MDYEDFLRQRGLRLWDKDEPRRQKLIDRRPESAQDVALWVKAVCEEERGTDLRGPDGHSGLDGQSGQEQSGPNGPKPPRSTPSTKSTASTKSTPPTEAQPTRRWDETSANAALVLIAVACSLLGRQLAAQANAFEKEGGFTERLYRTRSNKRRNS